MSTLVMIKIFMGRQLNVFQPNERIQMAKHVMENKDNFIFSLEKVNLSRTYDGEELMIHADELVHDPKSNVAYKSDLI